MARSALGVDPELLVGPGVCSVCQYGTPVHMGLCANCDQYFPLDDNGVHVKAMGHVIALPHKCPCRAEYVERPNRRQALGRARARTCDIHKLDFQAAYSQELVAAGRAIPSHIVVAHTEDVPDEAIVDMMRARQEG